MLGKNSNPHEDSQYWNYSPFHSKKMPLEFKHRPENSLTRNSSPARKQRESRAIVVCQGVALIIR